MLFCTSVCYAHLIVLLVKREKWYTYTSYTLPIRSQICLRKSHQLTQFTRFHRFSNVKSVTIKCEEDCVYQISFPTTLWRPQCGITLVKIEDAFRVDFVMDDFNPRNTDPASTVVSRQTVTSLVTCTLSRHEHQFIMWCLSWRRRSSKFKISGRIYNKLRLIRIQWGLKSNSDCEKNSIMRRRCIGFSQFNRKIYQGFRDNSEFIIMSNSHHEYFDLPADLFCDLFITTLFCC